MVCVVDVVCWGWCFVLGCVSFLRRVFAWVGIHGLHVVYLDNMLVRVVCHHRLVVCWLWCYHFPNLGLGLAHCVGSVHIELSQIVIPLRLWRGGLLVHFGRCVLAPL
jgi:hypothetical protein